MSNVTIKYREPEQRPIDEVELRCASGDKSVLGFEKRPNSYMSHDASLAFTGTAPYGGEAVARIWTNADDAIEFLEAALRMAKQNQ